MRIRATRLLLALAMAAGLATAGASGATNGPHVVLPDLPRTAVAQAHAAAAAGLSGLSGVANAHKRAPAVDAVLVPAALLATGVLAWAFLRRRSGCSVDVAARVQARAPPVRWQ